MRILLVHAAYRLRGGEDVAFDADVELLRRAGHEVRALLFSNADVPREPWRAAKISMWNPAAAARVAQAAVEHRAEVVHFHNTFPIVSPAAHAAASATGAAVVQTLHNYRLACVNALLFRSGSVCTDCVGKGPWLGAFRRCYRGNLGASVATAWTMVHHRRRGTWTRSVHQFLAVSEMVKQVAVASGLRSDRIQVRPNFLVEDPGIGGSQREGFLYLGRLSQEKGVRVVLELWSEDPSLPELTVAGEGPLRNEVERARGNVRFVGGVSRTEAFRLLKGTQALILPSLCLDAMPITLVEAFATGTPVIASRVDSLATMVGEGSTGYLFAPGNAAALAEAIRRFVEETDWNSMSKHCRETFEERYSPEPALRLLEATYRRAIEVARLERARP